MVAEEFLGMVGKLKLSTYVGVEDFADKLSFMFSIVIISISMLVVTVKSYFLKPLACYIATTPSGMNFDNYLENYCWVHGTIAILPGERLPQTTEEWQVADNEKRITYYQWVPFILALQCIMFYVPKIIWQLICYNKTGTDLDHLVNEASTASNKPPEERKDAVDRIARTVEDMLYQHREYRKGQFANARRKLYNMCNLCVFSKHMGTWLVMSYMLMKMLYCINVFGQLCIMKKFLGFNDSMSSFGYIVLNNIVNGRHWHESGIFPRVTYCYLGEIRHLGANNRYVAQCALPINMLNEKIYVFLWFWVLLVGIVTVVSIPVWFVRIAFLRNRSQFVKKFLIMKDSYTSADKPLLNHFINEFLRHDGVFLIRMLFINAGDLITSDIVHRLWDIYKAQYRDVDFRNVPRYIKSHDLGTAIRRGGNAPGSDDSIEKEPIGNFV